MATFHGRRRARALERPATRKQRPAMLPALTYGLHRLWVLVAVAVQGGLGAGHLLPERRQRLHQLGALGLHAGDVKARIRKMSCPCFLCK